MFYKVIVPSHLCIKLSQILVDHAEKSPDKSNIQAVCYIAHSAWSAWYQSKCWAGRSDESRQLVMIDTWVLLVIGTLQESIKKNPDNPDLQELFHCFTAGRQTVEKGEEKY